MDDLSIIDRFTENFMVASQTLREGDRPASTSGPELKDKS